MKQSIPFYLTLLIFFFFIPGGFAQPQETEQEVSINPLPLSEEGIFKSKEYFQWCSSVVKGDDGKYHLFYSRWPRGKTFYAWLTHSEAAHAVSNTPWGPWKYKETALSGRGKGHWDAITVHNPKIKYFNGMYYLYYVSTNMGEHDYTERDLVETAQTGYSHRNWKILRVNQRTGVAVSKSINGPWERFDQPLIQPSGPITTLTVNPAITQGPDGRFYLIVKGDKPNTKKFIRNQAIAIGDSPVGPFVIQENPVIDYMDTEDMSMWYDEQRHSFYGVFHAHNFIGMVTSGDGLNWQKASHFEIMPKDIQVIKGPTLHPDRLERPFVFIEQGIPTVVSLAVKEGNDAYIVFLQIASPVSLPNGPQHK